MKRGSQRQRGRPPKFGRAADLISITLPRDVITWLESIDDDVAWAIVKLHERATQNRVAHKDVGQLVRFPGNQALILVQPDLFGHVPGVALIPLSDGRAFLALDHGKGVADLELYLVERLESPDVSVDQRAALTRLRQLLKQWRHDGIRFEPRSIIVAHGPRSTSTSPRIPAIKTPRKS